jgi:hypothetical protein
MFFKQSGMWVTAILYAKLGMTNNIFGKFNKTFFAVIEKSITFAPRNETSTLAEARLK